MSDYSRVFQRELMPLPSGVDDSLLHEQGYSMLMGMTDDIASQLVERSKEHLIREMCANDADSRFASVEAVKAWLQKDRLPLPLLKGIGKEATELCGFGWMGPGMPSANEPAIPGAKTTFAVRLYPEARGRRLAEPYSRAIVVAHQVLHGLGGEWLEAWGDNEAAIKPYQRVGFEEVARVASSRHGKPADRVYMTLR